LDLAELKLASAVDLATAPVY
jgi:hypothetical protein